MNRDKSTITQKLSDNKTFSEQYDGWAYIKFWLKIYWNYYKTDRKLKQTLKKKICYYGPFKGEFGHFTAHTLPFLMYLHSKGVKIIYCGMALHKPFLVNEKKESIIYDYRPLRDFFAEVAPNSNSTIPPEDVRHKIIEFEKEATGSGYPFWNIGDNYYYWFIHRNWLLKGPYTKTYDLEKAYKTNDELSVCVFPRSKGAAASSNNGQPWDYDELINLIKPYFDKVYITGHPSQSLSLKSEGNVELCITSDNSMILEKLANSKLIITQHSGINNVGEYTNTKVLIIYKGGQKISDIGSIFNTFRFRTSLGNKHKLSFAFHMEEVVKFVKDYTEEYQKTRNKKYL